MKKWYKLRLVFIVAGIFMGVFLHEAQSMASQEFLIYEYRKNGDSGEVVEREYVQIEDLPSEQKLFKRKIEGNDYTKNEQFILGADYETQTWKTTRLDEGTDYIGEKKGNELFIKGTLRGEEINKRIELDDEPFYYTPKFNLAKFALSDLKRIKFWILRKDKLTKYLMQAKKIGKETIVIDGEEIVAIKVYCSATGIGEKFYKRIYFYRESDGLFIKKEYPDGSAATMVSIRGSNN